MPEKKNINLDIIEQLDQLSTTLENIAEILGRYYRDLARNGIPYELAAILTRDLQNRLLPNPRQDDDNV